MLHRVHLTLIEIEAHTHTVDDLNIDLYIFLDRIGRRDISVIPLPDEDVYDIRAKSRQLCERMQELMQGHERWQRRLRAVHGEDHDL